MVLSACKQDYAKTTGPAFTKLGVSWAKRKRIRVTGRIKLSILFLSKYRFSTRKNGAGLRSLSILLLLSLSSLSLLIIIFYAVHSLSLVKAHINRLTFFSFTFFTIDFITSFFSSYSSYSTLTSSSQYSSHAFQSFASSLYSSLISPLPIPPLPSLAQYSCSSSTKKERKEERKWSNRRMQYETVHKEAGLVTKRTMSRVAEPCLHEPRVRSLSLPHGFCVFFFIQFASDRIMKKNV